MQHLIVRGSVIGAALLWLVPSCSSDEFQPSNSAKGGAAGAGTGGGAGTSSGGADGGLGGSSGAATGGASSGGFAGIGGASGNGGLGGSEGGVDAGPSCVGAQDCGDTSKFICDPATHTCSAFQCSDTKACLGGQICVHQDPQLTQGACYTKCKIPEFPCPSGQTCIAAGSDDGTGFCIDAGSTKVGDPCTNIPNGLAFTDITKSDCEAGAICLDTCLETCDFWALTPDCPTDFGCGPFVCLPSAFGDSAQLGDPCAAPNPLCAYDGSKFQGKCDPVGGACLKACRANIVGDCPTGQSCNTDGICQ